MTLSQIELQLKNTKTLPRQLIGASVEFVVKPDPVSTTPIQETDTRTNEIYNRITNNTQLRRALWVVLFIILLLSIGLPVTLVAVGGDDTSSSSPPPSSLPCFDQQNIDMRSVVGNCTNYTTDCVNKYESIGSNNVYPCTEGSDSCIRSILYQLC